MKIRSIKQVKNLRGKRVLLRVGFDVPIRDGKVIDDFRIKQGLETIKFLISQGAKIILLNHLGRPKGIDPKLSNQPIAVKLTKLLNYPVIMVKDVAGLKKAQLSPNFGLKSLLMLENLRFWPAESKNDYKFAESLAGLGELYVNDAFSVSHRQSASVSAITEYLPSYAGLLLEKEVKNLSEVLESKSRPRVAVIGGAKLETKVKVIKNLLKKVNHVLVGGAIANNFIKAKGFEVGRSLWDKNHLTTAKVLLGAKLIIPQDVVVAEKISNQASIKIKTLDKIGVKDYILDIGPRTARQYLKIIKPAKMVVWNGPLGYFENEKFRKSSIRLAKYLAGLKNQRIIGGGETVELINQLKIGKKFTFISTGGGAMLEFLEGKVLPGIRPLIKN